MENTIAKQQSDMVHDMPLGTLVKYAEELDIEVPDGTMACELKKAILMTLQLQDHGSAARSSGGQGVEVSGATSSGGKGSQATSSRATGSGITDTECLQTLLVECMSTVSMVQSSLDYSDDTDDYWHLRGRVETATRILDEKLKAMASVISRMDT